MEKIIKFDDCMHQMIYKYGYRHTLSCIGRILAMYEIPSYEEKSEARLEHLLYVGK